MACSIHVEGVPHWGCSRGLSLEMDRWQAHRDPRVPLLGLAVGGDLVPVSGPQEARAALIPSLRRCALYRSPDEDLHSWAQGADQEALLLPV